MVLFTCAQRLCVRLRLVAVCACPLLAACAGPVKEATPVSHPPDVVLITVDTLRADRVGGALTPSINAVGARGARFLAARTTAPLTLAAQAPQRAEVQRLVAALR